MSFYHISLSLKRGWLLVAALMLAYAISFVDRQILSLVVDNLRDDLKIGDGKIGLLQGPAFGLFYAIMGLPLGWLADRVHRIRLIATGVALWTIMTTLGGFCDSFGWLFVTRMGVGVGEAALVPAAVSLLADSFSSQQRALPLAIFTAGVSLGAGTALVLGGVLIGFAEAGLSWLPLIGPVFESRAVWQSVLILAGLLGVPLALLILLLPEPRRALGDVKPEKLLPYLRQHKALFGTMLAGTSLLYTFSYALSAWLPSLFVRGFGWPAAEVGLRTGVLVLSGALIGNVASGTVATALVARGRSDGTLLTMALGATLLAPLAVGGMLVSGAGLALAATGAIYFALALCFGVASASFVAVTPRGLRGRMAALYLSVGNLAGMGFGPPMVGLLLDRGLGDPKHVGTAIAIVAAITVTSGAVMLWRALPLHGERATAITTSPSLA